MKILVLLYTQAEGGAPGFLSRKGEDAAGNLAQTLFGFAQDSLGIQLDSGHGDRIVSLEEDLRWKAYRTAASLPQAVQAAHRLFPDLMLFSGEHSRTLKTAEPVAQMSALPVCVDSRLDRCSDDKPQQGTLADALRDILSLHIDPLPSHPRCVWIATSQRALLEWLREHMDAEKWADCESVMSQSTQNDCLPAVFACGYEKTADGTPRWVID
ncbi:MAG: hypothetical protein EBR09_00165 [Proteobacteria bacterium]|nr:hypothetical protein [Pseudomonadota bacterium]